MFEIILVITVVFGLYVVPTLLLSISLFTEVTLPDGKHLMRFGFTVKDIFVFTIQTIVMYIASMLPVINVLILATLWEDIKVNRYFTPIYKLGDIVLYRGTHSKKEL